MYAWVFENIIIPLLKSIKLKKKRFLVVDNNLQDYDALQKILSGLGYKCDACFSGEQAIGMIDKVSYDIVFVSLKLPGMNGLQLSKHITDESQSVCILTPNQMRDLLELDESTLVTIIKKPATKSSVERAIKILT